MKSVFSNFYEEMYNDKKEKILCVSENDEKGLLDTLLKQGEFILYYLLEINHTIQSDDYPNQAIY